VVAGVLMWKKMFTMLFPSISTRQVGLWSPHSPVNSGEVVAWSVVVSIPHTACTSSVTAYGL
jgi:hypothetical protein